MYRSKKPHILCKKNSVFFGKMSLSADRIVRMFGGGLVFPGAYMTTCTDVDSACSTIYVRLPSSVHFQHGSPFSMLRWWFPSNSVHSNPIHEYDHNLQALLLYAEVRRRLKWYKQTFCLLRSVHPKLVVDLILCYCALWDRLLRFAIAQGSPQCSFRNFFCSRRTFIDVPVYIDTGHPTQMTVSIRLRQDCNTPPYVVLPSISDQKSSRMKWRLCSSNFLGTNSTVTFDRKEVPDATFLLLSVSQSLENTRQHDVLKPFSSLEACIGEDIMLYNHDDVYWFNSEFITWYFVPLRKVEFECKFAALDDDQKLMDRKDKRLTLKINPGSSFQTKHCCLYVGILHRD